MLLYAQLFILIVLVVLNIGYGIEKGLYFVIWWWDIPTHFLGGVWGGLFAAWFLEHWTKRITVAECAFIALGIGIGWEIFEYVFQLEKSIFMSYWLDTSKDLLLDTLGGALAGLFAQLERTLWQKKRK